MSSERQTVRAPMGAPGEFFQVGVVTADLEAAIESSLRLSHAQSAARLDTAYHARFRDAEVEIRNRNAFIPLGPRIHLELVEPVSGDGVQSAWLETRGPGVFHLAYAVDDPGDFDGGDIDIPFLTEHGTRYLDTTKQLGYYTELSPAARAGRLRDWVERTVAGDEPDFASTVMNQPTVH